MHSTPILTQRTIDRLLDEQPISSLQWRLIILLSVVFWFEGYDFQTLALAVPFASKNWDMAASEFGLALGAVYMGMGVAALLIAPLGDRYGRKPLVVLGTIVLIASLYGTASSTGLLSLFIWRLWTGLALGALLPNASALLAEYMPPRARSRALAWLTCSYALGALMSSFVASPIMLAYSWHTAFLFSAVITTLLLGAVIAWLPESLAFLAKDTRHPQRAIQALDRLGIDASPYLHGAAQEHSPAPSSSVLALLTPNYWRRTLVYWGLFSMNNGFVFTILVLWLPTLIANAGLDTGASMRSTAMIWGGGIVGGLALSTFMDRMGLNPWPLICALTIAGISLILFQIVPPTDLSWSLLLFGAGFGIGGLTFLNQAVGVALYPPELRASALGSVIAVPRLAGMIAPLLVGSAMAIGFSSEVIVAALAVPVGLTALLLLLLFRMKRPV